LRYVVGVGRGDEVFCSTFTFVASANAIVNQGAVLVFIDSDEKSWNMDPELLEEFLAKRKQAGKMPKAVCWSIFTDSLGILMLLPVVAPSTALFD
jgi:dTDP-4-amino-4,6-dideoxygalactose transaminase